MAKFVIKPFMVDAISVRDAINYATNDWKSLPQWIVEAYDKGQVIFCPKSVLLYGPEIGKIEGRIDDYVVKGHKGNFFVCNQDLFNETYQEVGD